MVIKIYYAHIRLFYARFVNAQLFNADGRYLL